MRPRLRAVVLTAALISQGAIVLPASAADGSPRVETIAEGLNNPRGIDVAADGTIYLAESGVGGDEHCVTVGEGDEASDICMGATGRVLSISPDGAVSTEVDGLPSLLISEGEYVGPSNVSVAADGSLYLSMGLGGPAALRDGAAAAWTPAGQLGTIQRFANGTLTQLADLAQWEAENDPNAGQPTTEGPQGAPSNDSNPNAVLSTSTGELYAADAGGNTVLQLDPVTGAVVRDVLFEDRFVDAPPFLGLPEGAQMPMQAVPTSLTEDPDGNVVVGQLTGFPFPVGGANVDRLTDDATATVATGFTNIMDVAYLDGELYVLEIAHNSLLGGFQGALVRVRADGTRIALLRDVLVAPGGIAAGDDGMIYITNNSVGEPGTGSVIRFDPSQAADAAIQSACPSLEVPGTALTDVADTTHEEAITCTDWHGLFSGFEDGSFAPNADMTRGQIASVVARLIRATDADLPAGDSGRFPDVDGTTHAESINDLAAAGLVSGFLDGTYRPNAQATRAQTVSILVAAYEYATGETLPQGSNAFGDIGGTHEASINAAAGAGWVAGTSPETFSPSANVRRGQMASIIARVASDLVDGGSLSLPA